MGLLLAQLVVFGLTVVSLVWALRRFERGLTRLEAVTLSLRAAAATSRDVRATFDKLANAVTDLQQHVGVEQETRRALDETAATLAVLRETAEAEVHAPRTSKLRGRTEPWSPEVKAPSQGVPRRTRTR